VTTATERQSELRRETRLLGTERRLRGRADVIAVQTGQGGNLISTLSKTALDYLVKEQQLAESGADGDKIKTEEPHTQQGLESQDLASRADSIAVQFESQSY
jgi:hypothetical protein